MVAAGTVAALPPFRRQFDVGQIPILLHSHIRNSVGLENVYCHQHRVERESYQKAHQTVMDPEQVPRIGP